MANSTQQPRGRHSWTREENEIIDLVQLNLAIANGWQTYGVNVIPLLSLMSSVSVDKLYLLYPTIDLTLLTFLRIKKRCI